MNKFHISYIITVDAETYEEARQFAKDIQDFIVEGAPEEYGISDIGYWDIEGDDDNEYPDDEYE